MPRSDPSVGEDGRIEYLTDKLIAQTDEDEDDDSGHPIDDGNVVKGKTIDDTAELTLEPSVVSESCVFLFLLSMLPVLLLL